MRKIVFISTLFLIVTSFTTTSKRVDVLIQKEIKTVFNIENYTTHPIAISKEVQELIPLKITETNFFKIKSDDNFLGYYYLGKAYGKADYFDFIVIFDKDLIVSKVKILVYREDHGGEVGSKRWLKQFIGTTKEQQLKYQKDIAAISGATISAKSMTNEVNKLLKTIGILNNKQQL
ncbi:MAG: FMN-binding protein [Lutibacter sp.]|uniref:FMN-binding protein n=1 Tax=Lutibacter sp. TaxID=1925666 RepID=UPI001A02D708|nr:FMN-binding protein [Lutibacter sp.]NOR29079.1 FMN-binding protein [Lutibacter sp.]